VVVGDGDYEAYTAIVWGVGMSHEIDDNVGAEAVQKVEGNMCGTAMRGADALPGSMATSRTKGAHRNLGDLVSPSSRPQSLRRSRATVGSRGGVAAAEEPRSRTTA
jgi:hypothetical protein